jgi:hypothetical protein
MVERLDNAPRMHSWIVSALVVSRYTGNMESFYFYAMASSVAIWLGSQALCELRFLQARSPESDCVIDYTEDKCSPN